jgi:hypothetical protein
VADRATDAMAPRPGRRAIALPREDEAAVRRIFEALSALGVAGGTGADPAPAGADEWSISPDEAGQFWSAIQTSSGWVGVARVNR